MSSHYFDVIPYEILETICGYLDPSSLRIGCTLNSRIYKCIRSLKEPKRENISCLELVENEDSITVLIIKAGYYSSCTCVSSHEDLFHYIWSLKPVEMIVRARTNHLRETLKKIPDWWLYSIEKLGIFESQCDIDANSFMSRLPNCTDLSIDPCFTVDNVVDIAKCMRAIHALKLISQRTVLCDDEALEILIDRSQKCDYGLKSFWADATVTMITINKVLEFIQNAKFSSRCSILLDRIYGREDVLLQFLRNEAELRHFNSNNYTFAIKNSEICLHVGQFV